MEDFHVDLKTNCKWLNFYTKGVLPIWFIIGLIGMVFHAFSGFNYLLYALFGLPSLAFIALVFRELSAYTYVGYHLNLVLLWIGSVLSVIDSLFNEDLSMNFGSGIPTFVLNAAFLSLILYYFRNRKSLFLEKEASLKEKVDEEIEE